MRFSTAENSAYKLTYYYLLYNIVCGLIISDTLWAAHGKNLKRKSSNFDVIRTWVI